VSKVKPDDYEAVRIVVSTLEPFDAKDQERILRWAREKLGLTTTTPAAAPSHETNPPRDGAVMSATAKATDIKSFIAKKNPQSDSQFVAAVAYYHRFEAPEPQRKDAISKTDLQDACRLTGKRIKHPAQTLVNAHSQGYIDKGAERGTYAINTVGENLVAMALPEGAKAGSGVPSTRRKPRQKARGRKTRP
jgi:hypothetical protein